MIVTAQKPLEEILDFLSPYTNILIVGCDGCTQPPRGLREAETLAQLVELGGGSRGKNFKFKVTTATKQCDSYLVATELRSQIDNMEAVLSLGCGAGVQTISELFPNLPVFPAQDTHFIGVEEREGGILVERCAACGDCLLAQTGGICPITRCSKGLLNGPCGGAEDGKCEVDPERDCAWVLIIERLNKLGRLDKLQEITPPKDWSQMGRPRKLEVAPPIPE